MKEKNESVISKVRRVLGNAVFHLPLSNTTKLSVAKSIWTKEQTKDLESVADDLGSSFDAQFKLFYKLRELSVHYAAWTTDERMAKVEGGRMIVSGAAMVMCDYMREDQIDAFYKKYIIDDQINQSFTHFWFRLAYQAKQWGFFKDAETIEETVNVVDEQELLNLFTRVGHELTRFVQLQTLATVPYDDLHAEIVKYLKTYEAE